MCLAPIMVKRKVETPAEKEILAGNIEEWTQKDGNTLINKTQNSKEYGKIVVNLDRDGI